LSSGARLLLNEIEFSKQTLTGTINKTSEIGSSARADESDESKVK